uniref:Uncharacterized protein n=1 Tax=Mantoniella antarctica TaxID=81844 RepID=A0A7S0XE83_9CHLO|mmetsp:Transcript_3703/g.9007  ORF Transcript_3703/g.9007 Transcript_3703/m.9007 type:complete len:178 (+) Transcript_3703:187-720(+)
MVVLSFASTTAVTCAVNPGRAAAGRHSQPLTRAGARRVTRTVLAASPYLSPTGSEADGAGLMLRTRQGSSNRSSPSWLGRRRIGERDHSRRSATVVRRAAGDEGGEKSSKASDVKEGKGGEPAEKEKKAEYSLGEKVDNALDTGINADLFFLFASLLTVGAVYAFAFGPRPPSDYWG